MKKKVRYTKGPMGKTRIVKDFLPSPKVLMASKVRVNVTIDLDRTIVEYFKKLSKQRKKPFRELMSNLLDHYASRAT